MLPQVGGQAGEQGDGLAQELPLLGGECFAEGGAHAVGALGARGVQPGAAGLGEVDQELAPVGGVGLGADEALGAQVLDGLGGRLVGDPRRCASSAVVCGPVRARWPRTAASPKGMVSATRTVRTSSPMACRRSSARVSSSMGRILGMS